MVAASTACAPAAVDVVSAGTMEPGEKYLCQRKNLTDEVYVRGYDIKEAGTVLHHGILVIGDATEPEGVAECGSAAEIGSNWAFVFGNSPTSLTLPDGVAFKIEAGKQLVLQLHLLNADIEPQDYEVAVNLETTPPESVEHVAQLTMMGSLSFSVPPGDSTSSGFCHLDSDAEVFAVLPHMHARGRHFKMTAIDGAQETPLVDAPFPHDDQEFVAFDPIPFSAQTEFQVDCSFTNPGEQTLGYGLTAADEMCFGIAYFYPPNPNVGPVCATRSRRTQQP